MTTIYHAFSQIELDREYSPSSCVDDINVYLKMYKNLSRQAIDNALANNACALDLRYGPGSEETLDLFMPDNRESAALHVFIHGGYWQLLSKNESSFAAPVFQAHDSFFAAINYTLAPQQTLTGIVEENRRAIAWLYHAADEFGIDRERIFLSGSSAGAHLCAMMLTTNWAEFGMPQDAVKGICAISGVYDLEPVRLSYVNDVVGMDETQARSNSPLLQPLRNRCRVVTAYGENETSEFKRQSDDYRQFLQHNDLLVTHREIESRNHFDVVLDLADDNSWLGKQVLAQMNLK